ncbi:MAG: hypothetical protein FWE61_03375 [Micrococcales bacterium]|nr:hypothetical protein [Micrococcales bacterium]
MTQAPARDQAVAGPSNRSVRAWVYVRRADPRRWPWWVQTLGVYTASRLWLVMVFAHFAARQPASAWAPGAPSYFDFVSGQFDGAWYRKIAECEPSCGFGGLGYPTDLPQDATGSVRQNAWAFFPAFPMLVRLVMNITGGSWAVTAPLVATVLGALAMLVIYRLVVDAAPAGVAARPGLPLATVAVVCVFPTAAVLQTAYTESLALLLIAVSVWAIVRRWYPLAALAVVGLGFTRAVALPIALVVVVHGAARWWTARQARSTDAEPASRDQLPLRDRVQIVSLFFVALASGFVWPWLTGWVTGVPDAYLRTQRAWRVTSTDPFYGWQVSQFWVGELLTALGIDRSGWDPRTASHVLETTTILLLLAAIALLVTLVAIPAGRRTGPELVAWSVGYLAYISAVVEPGSSLARFLLLAFPMAAVSVGLVTRHTWARRTWLAVLLVVLASLQVVWVNMIWTYSTSTNWPP